MEGVAVVPAPPAGAAARDWSELLLDVLCFLFADKLRALDVLMGAGLVCRSWLSAAKAPDVWLSVEMEHCRVGRKFIADHHLCAMAKAAADRSDGRLEVFSGERFVTNELLLYIAERSPALKTLRLMECDDVTDQVFIQVMKKAPLAELRRLEIEECWIINEELTAILDGCPHLEVLNLYNCCEIDLDDDHDLRAKCDAIKTLSITECYSGDDEDYAFDYPCYYGSDSDRSVGWY